MRTWMFGLAMVLACSGAAHAQSPQSEPSAEGSVTVHGVRRDDSSRTWAGGGVGGAWQRRIVGLAGEATFTRRDGHNDWHALAGPRITVRRTDRVRIHLQALAGVVIRQKETGWAGQIAGGIDLRLRRRVWFRAQAAGLLDQATDGRKTTVPGGRVAVGLVFR